MKRKIAILLLFLMTFSVFTMYPKINFVFGFEGLGAEGYQFYNGFEEGDGFTDMGKQSDSFNLTTAIASEGSRSVRSVGDDNELWDNIVTTIKYFYFSLDFYINGSLPTGLNHRFLDTGYSNFAVNIITNTSGNFFHCFDTNPFPEVSLFNTSSFETDRWNTVELYLEGNSTHADITIWLNGYIIGFIQNYDNTPDNTGGMSVYSLLVNNNQTNLIIDEYFVDRWRIHREIFNTGFEYGDGFLMLEEDSLFGYGWEIQQQISRFNNGCRSLHDDGAMSFYLDGYTQLIYVSVYVYVNGTTPQANGGELFLRIYDPEITVYIVTNSTCDFPYFRFYDQMNDDFDYHIQDHALGEYWTHLQILVVGDDASATHRIWVDRQSVYNATDNTSGYNVTSVEVSNVYWTGGYDGEVFIDSLIVDESYITGGYVTVEDLGILNLEGCGNWIFTEKTYNFYIDVGYMNTTLQDASIWFWDDSENLVNCTYDIPNDSKSSVIEKSGEEIAVYQGSYTQDIDNDTVRVMFNIALTKDVRDSLDVNLYASITSNNYSGSGSESSYFNIYNIGGHSEIETSGDAGKYDGTEPFELYANKGGSIRQNLTYRHFQHFHTLIHVALEEPNHDDIANGTAVYEWNWANNGAYYGDYWFGFDYCVNDTWLEGLKVRINLYDAQVGATNCWIFWDIRWYWRGVWQSTEVMTSFWSGNNEETDYVRMWIDLWINRQNGSTVASGRVGSYYWGMEEVTSWWQFWYGDWQPKTKVDSVTAKPFSTFTHTLEDVNDETISIKDISLSKVWCQIERTNNVLEMTYETQEPVEFSIQTASQQGRIEGVPTPTFEETNIPDMPSGGFLSGLFQWISGLAGFIANGFVYGFSLASTMLVNGLDRLIEIIFGQSGVFSGFVANVSFWLGQVWSFATFMVDTLGGFMQFLLGIGGAIGGLLTGFFNLVVSWISYPIQSISGMLTYLDQLWNGTGVFEGSVPLSDYWLLFMISFACFLAIGTANYGWGFLLAWIDRGKMLLMLMKELLMFGFNLIRKIIGILGDIIPF